ncbi:MAG: ubiquinol oxidase subunit II [Patescibacteria group bacterium]
MRKDKKRILRRVIQVGISSLIALGFIGLFVFVTQGRDIPLLETKGTIAHQERDLILLTFGLGLLVVVPVLGMLFAIAWKYRAGNKNAKYEPDMDGNKGLEALWWGIPIIIIIALAIITAISTHALDPYKPLDSKVEPVEVQVVALEWNWLFIYPEKGIATLNYLNIPEDTPINFTITSDAPMNSFWVPALGGQVYAMSGMSTKLHLMADAVGSYNGSSANISGDGFADMTFKVNSLTETDFQAWLIKSAESTYSLSSGSYAELAKPSKDNGELTYALMDKELYNEIIMKYMSHGSGSDEKTEEPHDDEHMNHDGMDM